MTERLIIGAQTTPRLARHAKLRFDEKRARWMVQAPEKLLLPDETAIEILKRCDGRATVDKIVAALAAEFDAPPEVIRNDVTRVLQDLADKRLVTA